MKKYQYLASWDDQTLTRVGEPVVVLGDSNVSQVEVTLPSDFLLDPTKAECRIYFLLPGEKESDHDVLETATKDENGDSHVTWTIKHKHSQKGGRLAFSLTLIGDDAQWDSRTAIIPVYESRYQPESEEAEEPYTGRLTALEGSMASIRGEFADVQDDFEELKETATLGTPVAVEEAADMINDGHIYIYTGDEDHYATGHVYYYVDGTLTDGGVYGGTAVDATLTQSGQAADAKETGDKIAQIKEDLFEKLTRKNKSVVFNVSDIRFGSLQSSSKLISGVGLYTSFGIISTGAKALLIEVTPGETVTIIPPVIDGVYFKRRTGFYDSTERYIKQEAMSDNMTITIAPANCTRIAIALYAYNTSDNTEHSLHYDLSNNPVCSLVYDNQYSKDKDYLTTEEVYGAIAENTVNDVHNGLLNSRFITSDTTTPLTILHISDIHADKSVITKIRRDINGYKELMQNIICTGDMVANIGGDISAWWYPSIMTCIGNHDSATQSGTTYNWNGVSMANREAYYITPYKDSWGDIVHTDGTSYYYKDYATEKVRLIVIDAMLYIGTAMQTEATAQTAWLANALSGAVSAGFHVLIATHAPHGGAQKIDCSFSQGWKDIMPTLDDCNTPQTVIDTVAQAITNGLHFIGYLCGHTHRDVLWDAVGDKSQLMYCITCANSTDRNQWKVGDLHRDTEHNAYNLVTIDTANTLVKIVRGGGADISNDMRTRKGICINYTTGDIVGEIL